MAVEDDRELVCAWRTLTRRRRGEANVATREGRWEDEGMDIAQEGHAAEEGEGHKEGHKVHGEEEAYSILGCR
jgi:hypothetical protein